ncbi:hypothetical protein B484DRAFT_440295, partial [Ochromonadaceae sp. CCMP2298]
VHFLTSVATIIYKLPEVGAEEAFRPFCIFKTQKDEREKKSLVKRLLHNVDLQYKKMAEVVHSRQEKSLSRSTSSRPGTVHQQSTPATTAPRPITCCTSCPTKKLLPSSQPGRPRVCSGFQCSNTDAVLCGVWYRRFAFFVRERQDHGRNTTTSKNKWGDSRVGKTASTCINWTAINATLAGLLLRRGVRDDRWYLQRRFRNMPWLLQDNDQ